jgi:hypothetical protein
MGIEEGMVADIIPLCDLSTGSQFVNLLYDAITYVRRLIHSSNTIFPTYCMENVVNYRALCTTSFLIIDAITYVRRLMAGLHV